MENYDETIVDVPAVKYDNGNTPLHLACRSGYTGIVKALLQAKFDIDPQNDTGNSPLNLASDANHEEIVELLIMIGADVNIPDAIWQTPLHIAAEKGSTRICKILLSAGANIELQDQGGSTPLDIAARGGFPAIVDMMIKAARIDYSEIQESSVIRTLERRKERLNTQRRDSQELIEKVITTLAFNQLKEGQWVSLALRWGFTADQIKAIQHEYNGEGCHKEHGYRMFMIWLDCLDPEQNPFQILYETLIAIHENELAESVKNIIPPRKELTRDVKRRSCSCSVL